MGSLVKSTQKEILRMSVYSSDLDDCCAQNLAFLQGAIMLTRRISSVQLARVCVNTLGMVADDAKMFGKQMSAALAHVVQKNHKTISWKKMHPSE